MVSKLSKNYEIIKGMYQIDPQFISFFPKEYNQSVDACFEKSMKEIKTVENELKFYEVHKDDSFVGYFALQRGNHLFTFFVHPNYRNKEDLKGFWNVLMSNAELPLYAAMVERNPRAIKFYEKMGGEPLIVHNNGADTIHLFKFNRGDN